MRLVATILKVAMLVGLICLLSCSNTTNTLQDAVNALSSSSNNPSTSGASPTTVIFSEERGDYAFVILGDSKEPLTALGNATFIIVDGNEGREWTLLNVGFFTIQGKTLQPREFKFGGNLAKAKSQTSPLDKNIEQEWYRKFDEYVKSKGYTISQPGR